MKRALRLLLLGVTLVSLTMVTQAATSDEGAGATAPEAVAAPAAPAPETPPPAPGEVKVLYSACSPGRPSGPGLFIADSDFSDPVRITSAIPSAPDAAAGYKGCDSGAWSPDGRRVVVSRNGLLHLLDLKVIGEFPDQQPVPVTRANGEPIRGWSPAWSPDGRWISFHYDDIGLAVSHPDGTGYRVIVPLTDKLLRADQSEFSPDEKSIAFRGGTTHPYHIYLVTGLYGSAKPQVRQLTEGNYQDNWPHFSPDGTKLLFTRSQEAGRNSVVGDLWVLDLQTGEETLLVDTEDGSAHGVGWCPFDNRIYFSRSLEGSTVRDLMVRVAPDGSSEQCLANILPIGRITWANTGAWIGSAHALPGEEVKVPIGMADAEELAEVISDVKIGDLAALGASRGRTIPNWSMTDPELHGDILSLHAFASDPATQNVSGPAHLFEVWLGVPAAAAPDEQRLLSFSDLYLANKTGQRLPRLALSGSVRTIPFAALRLEMRPPAKDDGDRTRRLRISALDREGKVMRGCNLTVGIAYEETYRDETLDIQTKAVQPVSPAQVQLEDGMWSGAVNLPHPPAAGSRVFVFWGDIGDYSPFLVPQ